MEPSYTLPEIARITGIPLPELEQYEREFGDLLPRPKRGPDTRNVIEPAAAPIAPEAPRRPSRLQAHVQQFRRVWRHWRAALRRVRWGPVLALGVRLALWWRRWQRAFEPA